MYSAAFNLTYLPSFRASSLIRRKSSFPHWTEYWSLSFHQMLLSSITSWRQRASCAHILVCSHQTYIITFLYITVRWCVAVCVGALVRWEKHHDLDMRRWLRWVLYGMIHLTTSFAALGGESAILCCWVNHSASDLLLMLWLRRTDATFARVHK